MSKFKVYAKSILLPVILGGIVGFFISGSMDYNSLKRPPLSPPSIVFPIVWTVLYILMGVSYGILKDSKLVDKSINQIYFSQLIVNLLWPIFFFVLKWRLFAFAIIIVLAILVGIIIYKFYSKSKLAGLLQLPYFLWTIFATYLNFGIYLLNK